MRIENPAEWPWNEWPRFVELLRAFAQSDEEQDAFFPDLQAPHYHACSDFDGYTLSSYSPAFDDLLDLVRVFSVRCENFEDEMFSRLWVMFRHAQDEVLISGDDFPYAAYTNRAALQKLRPELRALSREALAFWNKKPKPPSLSWEELVPQ